MMSNEKLSSTPMRATSKRADAPAPLSDEAQARPAPSSTAAAEASEEGPRLGRPSRKPFAAREAKLSLPVRPGFVRRFFNNDPGRIDRAKEAGYTHVLDHEGKPVAQTVGTAKEGGGLRSFAMEIPQEFYDEDFAAKQQAVDEIDRTIYRGQLNEKAEDGRYVPKDGIKMSVQRGGTINAVRR